MSDDIDKILKNSSKAELLEVLGRELLTVDKAIVILIEDKAKGAFSSRVLMLGISSGYEALGILEVAKQDVRDEE